VIRYYNVLKTISKPSIKLEKEINILKNDKLTKSLKLHLSKQKFKTASTKLSFLIDKVKKLSQNKK
jgi:hypothetical protein